MPAPASPDFTYDLATDTGRVRLLISDTDPQAPVFTDLEVAAFLAFEGGDSRLGAAQALETIATNEALVQKVLRTASGLQTDGAKLSAELRARAQGLRNQVAAGAVDVDDDSGGGFAVVGGISSRRWPELTDRPYC